MQVNDVKTAFEIINRNYKTGLMMVDAMRKGEMPNGLKISVVNDEDALALAGALFSLQAENDGYELEFSDDIGVAIQNYFHVFIALSDMDRKGFLTFEDTEDGPAVRVTEEQIKILRQLCGLIEGECDDSVN